MGVYYLIVNPDKREYVSASRFGENVRSSGLLKGFHGIAVSYLVCLDTSGRFGPLAGSWFGQRVIAAPDDSGRPNEHGIPTATADDSERNLYFLAKAEYEDISLKAMCMLATADPDFATEMVSRAKESQSVLINVCNAVYEQEHDDAYKPGTQVLRQALERDIGPSWQQQYQKACRDRSKHA